MAEKGSGAFLNNRRLRVAQRRDIHDTLLSYEIPHRGGKEHALSRAEISVFQGKVVGIRGPGSAALSLGLCRRRPLRCHDLPQHQRVGHRRRHSAGEGGRWLRHRSRQRARSHGNRQHPRHQRRPAAAIPRRAETGPRRQLRHIRHLDTDGEYDRERPQLEIRGQAGQGLCQEEVLARRGRQGLPRADRTATSRRSTPWWKSARPKPWTLPGPAKGAG